MSFNVSYFFFSSRRRHTRLQGDWSSDVCSSDLRGPELDVESLRLQMLPGQAQDLRVVGLAARRMGRFTKDAPARVGHPNPPQPTHDTRPAKASVSASATSSARSTSITCSMISP